MKILDSLAARVAAEWAQHGVTPEAIRGPGRSAHLASARREFVRAARAPARYGRPVPSLAAIAAYLNRSEEAIRNLARSNEHRRRRHRKANRHKRGGRRAKRPSPKRATIKTWNPKHSPSGSTQTERSPASPPERGPTPKPAASPRFGAARGSRSKSMSSADRGSGLSPPATPAPSTASPPPLTSTDSTGNSTAPAAASPGSTARPSRRKGARKKREAGRQDGWDGSPPAMPDDALYMRGWAYGSGCRRRYLAIRRSKARRASA